jgi:hypothetical protein
MNRGLAENRRSPHKDGRDMLNRINSYTFAAVKIALVVAFFLF